MSFISMPPLIALPKLSLPEGIAREQIEPATIVNGWLSSLEKVFEEKHTDSISDIFIDDCWWRDLTALAWDITTKEGQVSVGKYLMESATGVHKLQSIKDGAMQPHLMDMGGMIWVESGFRFETKYGAGRGIVRLANVTPTEWKAWTVSTQLERMKGQEELDQSRAREPLASTRFSNSDQSGDEDLQVLIIGAGQCGLALGAELKNMGLRSLIVDKVAKLGGAWLDRYDTVTTHTASYSDHYPFMKFPENWPTWVHREKIISWQSHYAQIMGLDVQLNSLVKSVTYDQAKRRYHVEIEGQQDLTPRHVVFSTGIISNIPKALEFPNQSAFKGKAYHAAHHKSASQISDLANKNVVIIGTGTTSHDVAQDFVNCGARQVTMIQRGPIFSVSTAAAEQFALRAFKTLPTEDADLTFNSFPLPVMRTMSLGTTQMMSQNDSEMLSSLEKVGLAVKRGEDGIPMIDYQLMKLGSFYIDQGANEMIIDGRIKIQRSEDGVKEFYTDGLVLGTGTKLDADIVVLATGTQFGPVLVENIMGKEFVDKLGGLGSIDEEHERVGWWRPTKFPGFWYMVGTFYLSRQFSRILALQINAIEKEFNTGYYDAYDAVKE